MKAAVLHEYGPPKNLKYEDFLEPKPMPGEVLVRVHAASINPIDLKMRSGAAQERFPVEFPAILGRDIAGTVLALGHKTEGFKEGDRVFALTWKAYAELCVVKVSDLELIPEGVEVTTAATVPLVSLTGDQLIRKGAQLQKDQTILITGALGAVGRCAVFCALQLGAKVIAGVRKKQFDEAKALGAFECVDINDADDLARLGLLDCIADTVGGPIATTLLSKIKPGGTFGSVLGPPAGAALHPTIQVNAVMAVPEPGTITRYAEAIRDGKLKIPVDRLMPLAEVAEAHAVAEKGAKGKIVLNT